jgi:MATE family multidrug resistance protein
MYGSILTLARHAVTTFFSGVGRTRIIMISAGAAMVVNICANYVLIFGKFGFPTLGIKGAAIGTVLGTATGLVITAGTFLSRGYRGEFGILSALRFDWGVMKKLLRYGLPPGFEFLLNMVAFDLLVMSFHSYGVEVAAAVTIAFNWDLVSFIPMIGVNIGITSLVGRFMGAGSPDTAHRSTISGLKVAVLYSAITFFLYLAFPHQLAAMFRPSDPGTDFSRIAPMAVFMIRMITVYVFGDAVALAFSGALRGAGDTFWTMVISIGGHWVLTLAALILVKGLGVAPKSAWAVVVFLILGIGIAFYLRYRTGRWRELRVVD